MNTTAHLVHLGHELESDLAEARRLVERGRSEALAQLDATEL